MFVALLLQAAQFLPAPTPVTGLPDTNYARQLLEHSQEFSVSQKQLESLHPATPAQFAEATIFAMGSEAQARLASMVLAGTENDAAARALYRAGCEATTSNTAVVCLLAPASLPPGVAPALAYLAQDPSKALAVRAAALARLIEHGRFGAWPLARALFPWAPGPWAVRPRLAWPGLDRLGSLVVLSPQVILTQGEKPLAAVTPARAHKTAGMTQGEEGPRASRG